jgi:predicted transcriptional regulator
MTSIILASKLARITNRIIKSVEKNGLIDYEVRKRCYRITRKGIRLLQLQNKMEEIAHIDYINIKNS